MAVVKYVLAAEDGSNSNGSLQTANSSTNALRILSRVAVGLRVVRILVNLRHARKLSGKVQVKLRGIVSQNRRRFLKHGFDLDATYITSRIIAMSAPSFGTHSAYRNDIHVVSRFLAYMHYGSFFVFNLCDIYHSSDKLIGQYHPSMLFHQVQRIPVEDHCPPLLVEVIRFCEDATRWMLKDQKNIIAAHCKGGKGRTGVFISALLVWSGHRRTALDALELFTFRRSDPYDPTVHFVNLVFKFLCLCAWHCLRHLLTTISQDSEQGKLILMLAVGGGQLLESWHRCEALQSDC